MKDETVIWIVTILIVAVLALFSGNSCARRCGTNIIDVGDTVEDVYKVCGAPAAQTKLATLSDDAVLVYNQNGGMHCTIQIQSGFVGWIDCDRG